MMVVWFQHCTPILLQGVDMTDVHQFRFFLTHRPSFGGRRAVELQALGSVIVIDVVTVSA
jgi:hypothetical protein